MVPKSLLCVGLLGSFRKKKKRLQATSCGRITWSPSIRSTLSEWNVLFKTVNIFLALTSYHFYFLLCQTNNNFSLVEALSILLPEFYLAFPQPDTDIPICASDTSLSGHYCATGRITPTRTVPVSHLLFFFFIYYYYWRYGLLNVAKHHNCSSFFLVLLRPCL